MLLNFLCLEGSNTIELCDNKAVYAYYAYKVSTGITHGMDISTQMGLVELTDDQDYADLIIFSLKGLCSQEMLFLTKDYSILSFPVIMVLPFPPTTTRI